MRTLIAVALVLFCMGVTACAPGGDSRWMVIYKYSIAPGNEVVWLTRNESASSDYTLDLLQKHCDDLKNIWKEGEGVDYFCSTVVFPGRAPKMISAL